MKYLLDTHALIWFSEDDPQLPPKVKILIEQYHDDFFISIATLWEISIKIKKGNLILTKSLNDVIMFIFSNGFQLLPITYHHTIELLNLPFIHKDPFDRMLISQSIHENMIIISNEVLFESYSITRLWN